VSTATMSAATVEAASAMEAATTPNRAAMESATGVTTSSIASACIPASGVAATSIAAPGVAASTGIAATPISSVAPVSAASPISTVTPAPAIPRAGADEHSAYKPPRAIEAVGCAGIGIIRVVTIRTHRRRGRIALVIVSIVIVPIGITLIGLSLRRPLIGGRALIRLLLPLIGVARIVSGANCGIHLLGLRVRQRQSQRSH